MNLSSELKKLANTVVYSKTTYSEYYNVGCIKIRISDHMTAHDESCDLMIFNSPVGKGNHYTYVIIPMIGSFREVQWFTNIKSVIDFIVRFESMARILVKNPGLKPAIQENITEDDDNTTGKVDYNEWKQKILVMYTEKNGVLAEILDEIYKLAGDKKMLKQLMRIGGLKHAEKAVQINQILTSIKK